MSYVFLSHNESSRELAERAQAQLETMGILTWVRDINIDWTQEENFAILGKAIQSSAALLVVVPRDDSDVADLSQDVHLGYQFAKPVLMLRNEEELPSIIQRLSKLVPERTEFSPLPQPIADEELSSGSLLSRYGGWLAAALALAALVVIGALLYWQGASVPAQVVVPSFTASPLPATATEAPITQAALLPTSLPSRISSSTPTLTQTATTPPSPTSTATIPPTRTPTMTASPTPTLSTASATAQPATTVAPSATRLPPSATPLPPSPTLTPSATLPPPSATPLPPSATALPPTATLVPTTLIPSNTPSPTLTETASGCPVPPGWIAYSVVSGDTVFSIARRAGSDVATLRSANCLADADVILVGQTLYLPPRTTATPAPTATVPGTEGCTSPETFISQPLAGSTLRGIVEVRGTATSAEFGSYRLEIRASAAPTFVEIVRVTQPVAEGVLWQLDTEAFPPGDYLLRLTVLTPRGIFSQPCTIPLIFG